MPNKVLFLDTETTGVPTYTQRKNVNRGRWFVDYPHIVQFSWILYDEDKNKILNVADHIIKMREGVLIPEGASNVHGITDEISASRGEDIKDVIRLFNIDLEACNRLVCHNMEFDTTMVRAEMLRNDMIDAFHLQHYKHVYCTMMNSIELCKIERRRRDGTTYHKYPKLLELHEHLFQTTPKGLHNSLTDIYVTMRCYYKMLQGFDIRKTSTVYKKNTGYIYDE